MVADIFTGLQFDSLLTHPALLVVGITIVVALFACMIMAPTPVAGRKRNDLLSADKAKVAESAAEASAEPRPAILPFVRAPASPPVMKPRPVVKRRSKSSGRRPANERRSELRRGGRLVRVSASVPGRPGQPAKVLSAWVVDRSRGGVRLLFPRALAAGDVIGIRAVNAPDDLPWVQLRVRHCMRRKKRWFLGCQFVDTLPWSVLLLFG